MNDQLRFATASRHATLPLTLGLLLAVLSPAPSLAQRLESQAIPGRPFGVAAVTLPAEVNVAGAFAQPSLTEEDNRVFYPAFSSGGLLRLLATDGDIPGNSGVKTVLFLFTGNAPLRLTISGAQTTTVVLQPEAQPPRVQTRLLQRWWRELNNAANELTQSGDYPSLVQTYLTGMLGQRLGLRPPLLTRLTQDGGSAEQQIFDLLLGTERLHEGKMRETLMATRDSGPANQPLPAEVEWRSPAVTLDAAPDVEPIANYVPEECFYIRFGNFDNYLWLEDLTTSYGGDIGRMVAARGQNAKAGDRIRKQLSLPQTALAKIFGSQLISDVALIGRDLYTQNGAALGVLFEARNSTLLSVSINQQRNATLSSERPAGAVLETVQVGGRDVSLLSTPDNRVRSYYAVDKDYHLVTTSRAVVERFFEAGDGKRTLAELPEFKSARRTSPVRDTPTIFAFFSTPFLSGLLSPQYQIELHRRLQGLVDLELVRLAQLAAAAEKQPSSTIEELVAAGFLPSGFGRQADGSGPIVESGRAIDSLRGARGTFLPIPDVELHGATAKESARYVALVQSQIARWQRLDPIVAVVRRESIPDRRERMTIEATVSPVDEAKYGKYLSVLGPPVTQHIVPRPGEVIYGQASVTGGQYSALVPPHLMFVGIPDLPPTGNLEVPSGILDWLRVLRTVPGYLGAWPKPGFVDWLPLRNNQVTPDGFSRLPFDLWRWQGDEFSVLSFQRDLLEDLVPQLVVAESDDPAQVRLHVSDLSHSQLREPINALYYRRAWQTSAANAKLLNSLSQQMRVPPDQSLKIAEDLLDTHLVCPLGGKYELTTNSAGAAFWRSTAWLTGNPGEMPADYQSPLLQWFRGLDFSLLKTENRITIRSQIDLQRN